MDLEFSSVYYKMTGQQQDLRLGLKYENKLHPKIKEKFGTELQKTTLYHPYDYTDGVTFVELKTRRINHNQYDTLMLSYSKVKYAMDRPNCKFFFVWNCLDGVYYHEFKHNKNYKTGTGGTIKRGTDETAKCVFIPINEINSM